LADYRRALLAPAAWAASTLDGPHDRFSLGPLTEVVAQHHRWADLAAYLSPGPTRDLVAHERVLRGEDLRTDTTIGDTLELPLVLQPWEPAYVLADYGLHQLDFPAPDAPVDLVPVTLATTGTTSDDADATAALRAVVEAWTVESNGRVEISAVEGDHLAALAAFGPRRVRVAEIPAAQALAWLAWAGASGGAHGRRRGGATGRFAAWWALAAVGGVLEDWPLPPDHVGELAHELRWFWWDAYEPPTGWRVQLAIWDPTEKLSWAIQAHDLVERGPTSQGVT
jgi:hypothetical protein